MVVGRKKIFLKIIIKANYYYYCSRIVAILYLFILLYIHILFLSNVKILCGAVWCYEDEVQWYCLPITDLFFNSLFCRLELERTLLLLMKSCKKKGGTTAANDMKMACIYN